MSHSATYTLPFSTSKRRSDAKGKSQFITRFFAFHGRSVLIGAGSLVLLAYLIFVQAGVLLGFQIKRIEARIEVMRTEETSLEKDVASLSSVESGNQIIAFLGFVPPKDVSYVDPADLAFIPSIRP